VVCQACEYCPSSYTVDSTTGVADDAIYNVTFGDINNSTGAEIGNLSYGDYTAISTQVVPGSTHTLSVTADGCNDAFGPYNEHVWAWIDWNQNCVLDDPGEAYDLGETGTECNVTLTIQVTVPADALPGQTRMRVIEEYFDDPGPCDGDGLHATTFGETEDYTVIVGTGSDCATCAGDADGNGVLNADDIDMFVQCAMDAVGACPCADMNFDGDVTEEDIAAFIEAIINQTGDCP